MRSLILVVIALVGLIGCSPLFADSGGPPDTSFTDQHSTLDAPPITVYESESPIRDVDLDYANPPTVPDKLSERGILCVTVAQVLPGQTSREDLANKNTESVPGGNNDPPVNLRNADY